jgi:hypothetical protein
VSGLLSYLAYQVTRWRPYSITRPRQPPCDSRSGISLGVARTDCIESARMIPRRSRRQTSSTSWENQFQTSSTSCRGALRVLLDAFRPKARTISPIASARTMASSFPAAVAPPIPHMVPPWIPVVARPIPKSGRRPSQRSCRSPPSPGQHRCTWYCTRGGRSDCSTLGHGVTISLLSIETGLY